MEQKTNNQTQIPMSIYTERFKNADPEEIARRCGLSREGFGGMFHLRLLNTPIQTTWPSFELITQSQGAVSDIVTSEYAKILVIRYLLEGGTAPASGKFMTYREMPWGEVYDANFQSRCIKRLALGFGGNIEAFCGACRAFGGTELTLGDASYELPVFESILVRLIIWASDEEFPPSAQILFSDNTVTAFPAEDRAVLGDLVINALKALSK